MKNAIKEINIITIFRKYWRNITNHTEKFRKQLIILLCIYLVAISALIRANFNYIDDAGRVARGYQGWDNFSRYVSNLLSNIIHADIYLTDVSPLPQLIAVCILVLSGVMINYLLTENRANSIWTVVATLPLGLSPYFLECLSYKYDSPYMALSILVSIIPLLFIKEKKIFFVGITVVCTLIMCTTYQAASGIYPMLAVALCFQYWNNGESIKTVGKYLSFAVIGYGIAMLIFKFIIMQPADTYVSNSLPVVGEIIPQYINHLIKYFAYIRSDFKREWLVLIGFIMVAYIYVMVRESRQNKYKCFFASLVVLFNMMILAFGMYPFLSAPLYAPRAMYGVGAFIAILAVSVSNARGVPWGKIAVICLCWCFFVFSFTYGNALAEQKHYTDFRIQLAVNDLNQLELINEKENKIVQLEGNIGKSPIINNMPRDYAILNRLVPTTFGGNDWDWDQYYFYNYFALKNVEWDTTVDLTEYNLPVLKDTMYHTIKGNEKYVLIELK